MRAGQVSGHARAGEIGAVETRARHLRREQARLDEAGSSEIDVKRPGLVQRRPVELGVRKVRVVEPRCAEICAGKVEAGKIEAGKALAGEIGPMPAGRRLERRFHLGARHLGRRHVRRGQVEAAHGVLGVGGKTGATASASASKPFVNRMASLRCGGPRQAHRRVSSRGFALVDQIFSSPGKAHRHRVTCVAGCSSDHWAI